MLKQSRVKVSFVLAVIAVVLFGTRVAIAQELGAGPYERLIIRGGTVIDGTGAPPIGSTDIVVEGNRIVEVRGWMSPPGSSEPATRVIDATGMYVLPGFVDLHGHIRDQPAGLPPEYIYKTWLVHGITTVRDAASHRGVMSSLEQRELSARNAVVAPRIYVYVRTDGAYTSQQREFSGAPITTPETARAYVRWAAEQGVDGFKSYGFAPPVFGALVDEAKSHGLGTAVHLGQMEVARLNAVDAARLGVTTLEHFYGLGEALLENSVVQNYVSGYDYNDEVDRFRGVALMWREAAEPGSDKWNEVMHALLETGVTLDPTMVIYSTFRDVDRAENMPWLKNYTHPGTLSLFRPSREVHAAFHYHWTTQFESEWKWMFKKWMTFLNEFKNRGGRVTIGTDAGVGLQVYGFSFIREMELLHEAGFNPLEVVRAATLDGARTIFEPKGQAIEFGVIEPGYLADLVIVKENPLDNFKVLYATGTYHVDEETGEIGRSEGIKYVVKDGIVYDADRLRQNLRAMVADAKRSAEWSTQGNERQ